MGLVEVPEIEGCLVATVEDGILVGFVGDNDKLGLEQIAGLDIKGGRAIDQVLIREGFEAVE